MEIPKPADILARAGAAATTLQAGLDNAIQHEQKAHNDWDAAKNAVVRCQATLKCAMEHERRANDELARLSAQRHDWQVRVDAFNDRMTAVNKEIAQLHAEANKATV